MSVDTTGGDYGDISEIKKLLIIPQNITKFDPELKDLIEDENRELGDTLSEHAATPDALTNSQKASARNVVNYGVCSKYKLIHGDSDLSTRWQRERDRAEKKLIAKLATDPDTNTQNDMTVVASEYLSSELEGQ